MKRKEFLKGACTLGVCSCIGVKLFAQNAETNNADDSKMKDLEWKIDFIHKRFAKLIEIMNKNLDKNKVKSLLQNLGRECANINNNNAHKYKNNLEGFLLDIQKKWVEKVEYNKDKKIIKIYDKKRDKCFCPFVNDKFTSIDFCNCSIGWQKETYESIIGKPVEVTVEESVLRGGERCSFTIKFA